MTRKSKPNVQWMPDHGPSGTLHIETPNGIVNIMPDVTDTEGRQIDVLNISVEDYAGAKPVRVTCKASGGKFAACKLIRAKSTRRRKH